MQQTRPLLDEVLTALVPVFLKYSENEPGLSGPRPSLLT